LILLVEFAYSDKEKFLVYLSLLFILFVITNFDYILLFYGLLLFTALVSFPIQLHSYKKTVFSRIAFSLLVTIIFSLMVNFLFFKSYKIVELLISGILNIFISMILFFGLTPIIENIFNFPTNSKLLEICDLNNQFFSDFMLKAPGTYHHSVIVATLAEKAAASCNCNPYIAKAGGLYHDIGKIRYSKYFVENQHGENPTVEVLNPNMAVTIIKNHVKYGVIEAQKLHLPKEVIDIIEEHHGTSLISYFYVKALEKKLENVNKINFCYNYPKPKTKEAAIIMIADSIEAASRTLKNTDKKSIEKMVEDVIANKSKEGQLEESPITLKDLYFIKKSIINSLYSMYHNRVNYPDEKELKKLEEENR
jgi:putative nucleotidyltransferase with HDIG domain